MSQKNWSTAGQKRISTTHLSLSQTPISNSQRIHKSQDLQDLLTDESNEVFRRHKPSAYCLWGIWLKDFVPHEALCFLSIAWIFEKQIGNEVFQNWCYIRHVHSWYALTYVLLLRSLVLSSKVKFHFSLGPLLHVCVCAHVCVCVRCGPVITSGRVACFAPALSAYISHWREHKWKSVKVLIQESSGSDRHSHDFSHGAIDVSHYILTGLDLWN